MNDIDKLKAFKQVGDTVHYLGIELTVIYFDTQTMFCEYVEKWGVITSKTFGKELIPILEIEEKKHKDLIESHKHFGAPLRTDPSGSP